MAKFSPKTPKRANFLKFSDFLKILGNFYETCEYQKYPFPVGPSQQSCLVASIWSHFEANNIEFKGNSQNIFKMLTFFSKNWVLQTPFLKISEKEINVHFFLKN